MKSHLLSALGRNVAADSAALAAVAKELASAAGNNGCDVSVVRRKHVERLIAAADGEGKENVKTVAKVRDPKQS